MDDTDTHAQRNFIFVLKTRGSITDCTIRIKGRHVRTVATVNDETINRCQASVEYKTIPNFHFCCFNYFDYGVCIFLLFVFILWLEKRKTNNQKVKAGNFWSFLNISRKNQCNIFCT